MKAWLENIVLRRAELINAARSEREQKYRVEAINMKQLVGAAGLSKGSPEGEDRISFELSTAVGGRILNVRRYNDRTDRHDQTTYVIPSGEDVGARVAKILNLELIK